MGLTSRLLRLPRPRTFLYTMSLTTGASLITLSLLLNKLSGLYGLLALLTGFELNSLQFSMYIYSLIALALTAYLAPHIRTQSPLHALALAWFYIIDSIINAAYTVTFGVTWFLVLAQHHAGISPSSDPTGIEGGVEGGGGGPPGAGTIDDTAGFTSPEYNASSVEIVDDLDEDGGDSSSGGGGQFIDTPASWPAGTDPSAAGSHQLTHGVLQPESMNSLGVVIALWTIRLYFCVVMLSYARMVLRTHIARSSAVKNDPCPYTTASTDATVAQDPFAPTKPDGQGWRGRLGRLMLSFPRQYWLGQDGFADQYDVSWMQGMGGGRFKKGNHYNAGAGIADAGGQGGGGGGAGAGTGTGNAVESGPTERERRRRSGTGPPPPLIHPDVAGQNGLSVPLQDLS